MLLLFLLFPLLSAQTPSSPLYFPTWSANFTEKVITSKGKVHTTTGTSYYDSLSSSLRVDRETAGGDTFCSLNGLKILGFNGKCSHFVVNGNRYLYYPEEDECCLCCGDEDGCGMLRPNWLQNAEFLGETEHNGVQTYEWNQHGAEDNYYYETVAEEALDREIVSVYQGDSDLQDFWGYSHYIPEGVFDLPTKCTRNTRCSVVSWCSLVVLGRLFS